MSLNGSGHGVGESVAASFDFGFREINGRAPTADETKRYLTYERLAKTSEPPLDPLTMLLMVDAGRVLGADRAELETRLDRIEALLRRNGKSSSEPIIAEPMRYLFAFTAGVLACLALAIVASANRVAPSFVALTAAFALGLCVALAYQWLAPTIRGLRR